MYVHQRVFLSDFQNAKKFGAREMASFIGLASDVVQVFWKSSWRWFSNSECPVAEDHPEEFVTSSRTIFLCVIFLFLELNLPPFVIK